MSQRGWKGTPNIQELADIDAVSRSKFQLSNTILVILHFLHQIQCIFIFVNNLTSSFQNTHLETLVERHANSKNRAPLLVLHRLKHTTKNLFYQSDPFFWNFYYFIFVPNLATVLVICILYYPLFINPRLLPLILLPFQFCSCMNLLLLNTTAGM